MMSPIVILIAILSPFVCLPKICEGYNIPSQRHTSSSLSLLHDATEGPPPYVSCSLSQRSVINQSLHMTQRDPIRMPSETPMVPYKPPGSDYAQFIDIEAAMYRDRTLMINRYIDESYANSIISIILYLRNESPREKLSIYFNVPGGQLRPSLAIYDLLQNTKQKCEIETVNLALCGGFSSLLCAAGTKGKRHAFPNARFILQRIGMDKAFQGQARDIALEVKNVKAANDRMELELAALTGQDPQKILKDMQRDMYLVADEAVQYGLIDSVLLPSDRKRAARGGPTDLGTFEGEDKQRYQNQPTDDSPPGSQQRPPPGNQGGNNDDGPEILKG